MNSIPAITSEVMREVDRLMVEKYEITLPMMMENAGRNLADLARRVVGGSVADLEVAVAVGRGNNGGGGLVAARNLHNWGAKVVFLLPGGPPESEVPILQLGINENIGLEAVHGDEALDFVGNWVGDIVLDAMIGYGLVSAPRGRIAEMVEKINSLGSTVISLDVPTGLDSTSGHIHDPCIRANATLTLALPKIGLISPGSERVVGDLYLADIGVPAAVYEDLGIHVGPIFSGDTIVRL